ncbi:hypothetical protein AAFF_G00439110 [Aldrovandia affinis]|uniref:RETREG1-3/ARL6IP-like N-terminal reticulon-homology domain-containing protein n=1 Tax=Aldrovandia affinis TaxID=143900 RepID=A0AAD7WHP7_9TELE|nr:hypothetical protein AAFF_G00439110 [Aldrovandia affinis]
MSLLLLTTLSQAQTPCLPRQQKAKLSWASARGGKAGGTPLWLAQFQKPLIIAFEMAPEDSSAGLSWEVIASSQESRAGAGQFTDSWISCKLFLQEMSSFKQHNPGKFCLLVCSLCTFFAVLGQYIPGIIISYVAVLAVFLWPLLLSHEFGLWVEPVLQKLDFGVGDFLQRMRENHEKRILQRQEERSDADLSALFTKLDSSICKELSISDNETAWTENSTFDLPEGHTPEAENSEDLDHPSDQDEEVFTGALPDIPSVDNRTGIHDEDDKLSLGLQALPPPPPPRPTGNTGPQQGAPKSLALELVDRMAGDVIAAAVTAAIQEQLEAQSASPRPVPSQQPWTLPRTRTVRQRTLNCWTNQSWSN